MSRIAGRKPAWGFGPALALLATNALISYHDLAELSASTGHVLRARDVLEGLEEVVAAFKDAEVARRGHLVDGNPRDLADFERASATAIDKVEVLVRLT